MIALLSLCPIRLRNFAELRIGRQIRRIGDTWWIILEAAETKSAGPMNGQYPRSSQHISTVAGALAPALP